MDRTRKNILNGILDSKHNGKKETASGWQSYRFHLFGKGDFKVKELLDLLKKFDIEFWTLVVAEQAVRFEIRRKNGPDGFVQMDKQFSLDVFQNKTLMLKAIKAALKEFDNAERGE